LIDPRALLDPPYPPVGAAALGPRFDRRAGDAAVQFFPARLRFTKGEWAGRPFALETWQAPIVRAAFGWKRRDGTRLYRRVYVEMPRKNGKTEFGAGVALVVLLGDGEPGGEVYCLATDEDQANIPFSKAAAMVRADEVLAARIEPFKTSLFVPELMAVMKPLSSVPHSKHGFNPSGSLADELHAWKSGELAEVVHEGTAARRQPLEIEITSAGIAGQGYGWERHEHARQVIAGQVEDPTLLAVIYGADPEDDWTAEATWRKANPNFGVSVKPDYLAEECRKAQQSERLKGRFLRYHLGVWTEQVTAWLPGPAWRACSLQPANAVRWREMEAELAGRRCWGGLDLASTRDTCSLCWVFPPVNPVDPEALRRYLEALRRGEDPELPTVDYADAANRWHVLWRFWLPQAGIDERVRRENVPWRSWAQQGALTLTEGNVTDYGWIAAQVQADGARFDVAELAYDPWNATHLATALVDDGAPMVQFRQGFGSMSEPAKLLERLVLNGGLEHGNQPVARWMADNVAIEKDAAENIKPSKAKSTRRIDGIVAAVMGLGRAAVAPPPPARSFWESAAA